MDQVSLSKIPTQFKMRTQAWIWSLNVWAEIRNLNRRNLWDCWNNKRPERIQRAQLSVKSKTAIIIYVSILQGRFFPRLVVFTSAFLCSTSSPSSELTRRVVRRRRVSNDDDRRSYNIKLWVRKNLGGDETFLAMKSLLTERLDVE